MKATSFLLSLVLLLLACGIVTPLPTPTLAPSATFTQTSTLTFTPTLTPTSTATLTPFTSVVVTSSTHAPGWLVRGRVTFDGAGLAGVSIYRNYAMYPGELIATTDADGYYQSAFMGIPGDEMVSVWAELQGYIFDPPDYHWRHYHGYEETTLDFTALLTP